MAVCHSLPKPFYRVEAILLGAFLPKTSTRFLLWETILEVLTTASCVVSHPQQLDLLENPST